MLSWYHGTLITFLSVEYRFLAGEKTKRIDSALIMLVEWLVSRTSFWSKIVCVVKGP